jgi:hypothetical protein
VHDVRSPRPEGYPSDNLKQPECTDEKIKTLEVVTKYRQHEECERAGIRMSDPEEEIKNVRDSIGMVSPEGYPSGCLGRPMREFESARREGYPSDGSRQLECISEKIKPLCIANGPQQVGGVPP